LYDTLVPKRRTPSSSSIRNRRKRPESAEENLEVIIESKHPLFDVIMAAGDGDVILMPLRTWMENVEREKPTIFGEQGGISHGNNSKKELIIRKTTIAYGVVELLQRSNKIEDEEITIDNFAVSLSKKVRSSRPWDDIKGVSMISSGMSITIEEPSYLSGLLEGDYDYNGQIVGRCLEVELTSAPKHKQ